MERYNTPPPSRQDLLIENGSDIGDPGDSPPSFSLQGDRAADPHQLAHQRTPLDVVPSHSPNSQRMLVGNGSEIDDVGVASPSLQVDLAAALNLGNQHQPVEPARQQSPFPVVPSHSTTTQHVSLGNDLGNRDATDSLRRAR